MILPEKYKYLELNPEFELIIDKLLNTDENLHIIGPAGSGKTTLLRIISDDEVFPGNKSVVSPTGIAAVNASSEGIKASTVHSFFGMKPLDYYLGVIEFPGEKIIEKILNLEILIIDEVSLLNASAFDYIMELIDEVHRVHNTGKFPRIILFSDPYQLGPVIRNEEKIKNFFGKTYQGNVYYFNSDYFRGILEFKTVELTKIYRQADGSFQNTLNRIRKGTYTLEDLDKFNICVRAKEEFEKEGPYIHMAIKNETIDRINDEFLNKIDSGSKFYKARVTGEFDVGASKQLQQELKLKIGLQVMITKNGENYQNGTLAEVLELGIDFVKVKTQEGKILILRPETWRQYDQEYNESKGKFEYKEVGTFTQIPLKQANAMTVHKSQGQTFSRIYFNMGTWLGMDAITYVALSRCKTLEGICLSRKLKSSDININSEVSDFMRNLGE